MSDNKLGEIAMELISDHPLYASTSGITYEEAIGIAQVIFGHDLVGAKREIERVENLTMEELDAEIKQVTSMSLEDVQKKVN